MAAAWASCSSSCSPLKPVAAGQSSTARTRHFCHRATSFWLATATSPLRTFIYGDTIDEPIALVDGSSGSGYFYHRDRRFSVVALTDASGAVVERYAYSAYGKLTIFNAAGTAVFGSSTVGNEFTYTGRRWDATLELYDFRARRYDPRLGRFIGRDPLG